MPICTLSHLGEFLDWVPHSGEFLHWVPTSSCWLCWVRLCTFPLGPLVLWTAPKYSHIGAHNPAGGGNQALCMCTFPGLLCTLGYSWEFPHWCPLLSLVARTRHCVCMFQCALGNSHLTPAGLLVVGLWHPACTSPHCPTASVFSEAGSHLWPTVRPGTCTPHLLWGAAFVAPVYRLLYPLCELGNFLSYWWGLGWWTTMGKKVGLLDHSLSFNKITRSCS